MGTDIDLLVIGNSMLWKQDQDLLVDHDYKNQYELD